MKFFVISFVVLVAMIAIGTLEVSSIPTWRSDTVKDLNADLDDGLFMSIRPEIHLRHAEQEAALANPEDFEYNEPIVTRHYITRRSPDRVVINYKPPPPNGPRYARSADAEETDEFEVLARRG